MSVETTRPRNELGPEISHSLMPRPSPVSVVKSNSCHQFSVAALTDEPTTTTDASLRSHSSLQVKSSKSSARISRRANTKLTPVQHTLPEYPSLRADFPPHSRAHPSSYTNNSRISGSPVPITSATSFHTRFTIPHPDVRRSHLASHPTSGRPTSIGDQAVSITSSPALTSQCHPHVSSRTSGSREWNSPVAPTFHLTDNIQSPDPRVLQRLMGIDTEVAERLLNDARFNDLYSFTLPTFARGGANGDDTQKHLLHNGFTDVPKAVRTGNSIASTNTFVPATSSPLATNLPTSTIAPNHIKRNSVSDGHIHETSVINFNSPCDDHSLVRTQALLHNAYNDRELVSRLPVPNNNSVRKVSTSSHPSSRDASPAYAFSSLPHSASLIPQYLPPPPPLIAGCAQPDLPDPHGFPRTSLPSADVLHRLRFSSSHIATSHTRIVPTSSPVNSLSVFAPSVHLPESTGHVNQKQWETLFREKMLTMAATCNSNLPVGVGPPNLSIKGKNVIPSKVPAAVITVTGAPTQSRASFEANASQSFTNPPPPYHTTNPLRFGPLPHPLSHRPTLFYSSKGAPEQTKRQLANLLRQPVHKCGRWADAHVRIARFIEHQQLFSGSRTPCDEFVNIGPASSFNSRCLIRPVPRPLPPFLPRISGPVNFPALPSFVPPSQLSSLIAPLRPPPPSNSSLNTQLQQPVSSSPPKYPSDGIMDNNALLTCLFNGMLSTMSPDWISSNSGHFFSKEMSEMLWNSTVQKLCGQPVVPQGPGQPKPSWTTNNGSSSSSSILDLTHSTMDPSDPLFAAGVPLHPPDPSGLLTSPNVSTVASSHSGFSSITNSQNVMNTKRRRLDVPPLFQPTVSHSLVQPPLSLPLHSRMFHPLDLLAPTVQKPSSQLNGCYVPDLSDRWNTTNPFVRLDANYPNCAESGLKLSAPPSHLAPIHPW